MIIIKFGGSVITDKRRYKKFNTQVVKRLVSELPESNFILVHGAGSYGHIISKQFALQTGLTALTHDAYARVHADMLELNTKIINILLWAQIPAISIPPHAFHIYSKPFEATLFEKYLELNYVPVTFGDIILHPQKGMGICSGDYLMWLLALHFKPNLVIFVTDVDGLYTKNPKLYKDARFIKEWNSKMIITTDMLVSDVTGGLQGKLANIVKIAELGIEIKIVNGLKKGRLKNIIMGKSDVYTTIKKRGH